MSSGTTRSQVRQSQHGLARARGLIPAQRPGTGMLALQGGSGAGTAWEAGNGQPCWCPSCWLCPGMGQGLASGGWHGGDSFGTRDGKELRASRMVLAWEHGQQLHPKSLFWDLRLFSSTGWTGGKREHFRSCETAWNIYDWGQQSRSQDVTSPAGFICSHSTAPRAGVPPARGHPVTQLVRHQSPGDKVALAVLLIPALCTGTQS